MVSYKRMNRQETERAILDAARYLFARHGYRGASVREITRRARANLGAVTYHFGSKENLYLEIVRRHRESLRGVLDDLVATDRPPLERIDTVLRGAFDYLRVNPEIAQILLQELSLGRALPEPMRAIMQLNVQTVAGLIREGQRDGTVVAGDPVLLALNVLAHPFYFAVASKPIRDVMGLDRSDPAAYARVVDTAAEFVLRSLQKRGGTR